MGLGTGMGMMGGDGDGDGRGQVTGVRGGWGEGCGLVRWKASSSFYNNAETGACKWKACAPIIQ